MKSPKLETETMAEFIGIMLGDGSIGKYKCGKDGKSTIQYRTKVTLSKKELSYRRYILDLFKDLFDINLAIWEKKTENAVDLQSFDEEFFKFITRELGLKVAPKRNRARVPENYMCPELWKGVLKGYFDTDGSLVLTDNNGTLYPRIEMKVCQSPMQMQLVKILRREGFHFGRYEIGNGNIRLQLNGKEQLAKWVQNVGISNKKHINKLRCYQNSGE